MIQITVKTYFTFICVDNNKIFLFLRNSDINISPKQKSIKIFNPLRERKKNSNQIKIV